MRVEGLHRAGVTLHRSSIDKSLSITKCLFAAAKFGPLAHVLNFAEPVPPLLLGRNCVLSPVSPMPGLRNIVPLCLPLSMVITHTKPPTK